MQEEPKILHKLEAGKRVRIFKTVRKDIPFYKVQLTQKNYEGTVDKYYFDVMFKKGVELPDPTGNGIDIIIKCAYENFKTNPADQYHPIIYYLVTDFDIVQTKEQKQNDAFNEFRENLDNMQIEITDDFLD